MFKKDNKKAQDVNAQYEEMEVAEELGDGWFIAGVATGVAIGVGVVVLT